MGEIRYTGQGRAAKVAIQKQAAAIMNKYSEEYKNMPGQIFPPQPPTPPTAEELAAPPTFKELKEATVQLAKDWMDQGEYSIASDIIDSIRWLR